MKKKHRLGRGMMGMGMGMMKQNLMGMGMMGMQDTGMMMMHEPAPRPINNPILLLNSYPPFAQTSVINQNISTLEIKGGGIISRHFRADAATSTQFTLIVNVLLYAPNTSVDPMIVFDDAGENASGTRLYSPAFQYGFGLGQNAFQHAMFYLNNIPPFDGTLNVTVKHPPCQRRMFTVDQFANISSTDPLDQHVAAQATEPGLIEINSGTTDKTSQDFELVYGSIALGRDYNQYSEPDGFIPIKSVGSNIDTFDTTLKTYYKMSAQPDTFNLSALVASGGGKTTFWWSSAIQTFKAAQ